MSFFFFFGNAIRNVRVQFDSVFLSITLNKSFWQLEMITSCASYTKVTCTYVAIAYGLPAV